MNEVKVILDPIFITEFQVDHFDSAPGVDPATGKLQL